jgi:hypothetical protein
VLQNRFFWARKPKKMMNGKIEPLPDTDAGISKLSENRKAIAEAMAPTSNPLLPSLTLGTKKDVAAMLRLSPRTVDTLLRAGLPYCKLGKRRTFFDLPVVRTWFLTQYGVQRIGKMGGGR